MTSFAGLDVSVRETAVCVIDQSGKVVVERKVPTEPDDIVALLRSIDGDYSRIGLEAGPLSQWLVNGLAEAGLPVVCVETRHMKALLEAQTSCCEPCSTRPRTVCWSRAAESGRG